jgi:hypothetical protein
MHSPQRRAEGLAENPSLDRASSEGPPSPAADRILEIDAELAEIRLGLRRTALFVQVVMIVSLVLVGWKHLVTDPDFLLTPLLALGIGGVWGTILGFAVTERLRHRARLQKELDTLIGGTSEGRRLLRPWK